MTEQEMQQEIKKLHEEIDRLASIVMEYFKDKNKLIDRR